MKAEALGFGDLFQETSVVIADTANPGEVFRLFGKLRDTAAQQGK